MPICDAPDGRGGAWLDDGTIVFAPTASSGLWRVPATGGAPVLLLDRQHGEAGLKFPVRVDRRHVLFWAQADVSARSELRLLDLDLTKPTPVVVSRGGGAFDRGTLFYWREGVLLGQRLDVETGRLSGNVARLAVDVPARTANVGAPNVSAGGGHVAVADAGAELNQLTWVDRSGRVTGLLGNPAPQTRPELSSDGNRLVLERQMPGQGESSLWLLDLDVGSSKQLTSGDSSFGLWSPDNSRLLFRSMRGVGGNGNLYQLAIDDPIRIDPVMEGSAALWPAGWLPSGNGIVFQSNGPSNPDLQFPTDILVKHSDVPPTVFRSLAMIDSVRLSPDATRIAYVTRVTGQSEVILDTFPTPAARPVQVSRGGGSRPHWSGDGRELFFLSGNRMMLVATRTGLPVAAASATPLFSLPPGNGVPQELTVHHDSSRFLVVVPTLGASPTVKMLLNWSPAP